MSIDSGSCNLNLENNQNVETPLEFDIEAFLKLSVSQGASDIHLRVGTPPMIRRNGFMLKSKLDPLNSTDMQKVLSKLLPNYANYDIEKKFDMDFSFEISGLARFRVNVLHDFGNLGFVLRIIPFKIPSMDTLYLPTVIKKFTQFNNGLILVTGPTGSGKSTTLASILDYINQNQQKHVVTIEDPVEFQHNDKKCMFTQRQIGIDTDSFVNGLKYALRQDPDIILIGEMRDRETISSALKAAETGHLVFSTLHTTGAVQTINRIINAFEPHERDAVRIQIASILRGTIAQKLVPTGNGKGRVPSTEVLMVTPAIRDYILKDEIDNIYQLIREGSASGMMTLDMSLYKLVKANLITLEAALSVSDTPNELEQMLKGAFHGQYDGMVEI